MTETLIGLLIAILIVGLVAAVLIYLIDMLPIDAGFKQVARVIVLLVAVLLILARLLPGLGVGI